MPCIIPPIPPGSPIGPENGRRSNGGLKGAPLKIFHELLAQCQDKPAAEDHFEDDGVPTQNPSQSSSQYLDVTYSFLRLVNLNNGVLERIGRYEVSLWRQVAQTLLLLESFRKGLARTIREGGY